MTTILITGMHRSGSSMVAQALQRAGLYLGPASTLLPPAPDNPEGFFEHEAFVRMSDDLLEACGGAWDHLPPVVPMAADDPRVEHLADSARALLEDLARAGVNGWKDPRGSLTVQFWQDLVPNLKVVVCVRNPLEVAMSLKKRNGTSYLHALSLWEGYYSNLLSAVEPANRIVTHYDSHFTDAAGELTRLAEFIGLPAGSIADAASTRNAELRHHEVSVDPAAAGVRERVAELYAQLCVEAGYNAAGSTERVAGSVNRDTVDLLRSKAELERRGRHISSLQRERDELAQRLSDLENAGRGRLLDSFNARLNALEDAVHEPRYWIEGLADRTDADVIRGCRELVRELPHRDRPILVLGKGDPVMLDLYGRPTWTFPSDSKGVFPGFSFSDSASAIAHLEAARTAGAGYLLVPHTFRWWLNHYAGFTEHLVDHYVVAAERAGEGVVFDLRERRTSATGWPLALTGVLDRIATVAGVLDVSVLDWTATKYATHLTGRNVFTPPTEEPELPYIDRSVDVVLLDEAAARDEEVAAEAARVARYAVLTVTAAERAEVLAVAPMDDAFTAPRKPVVRLLAATTEENEAWQAQVLEALADESDVQFTTDSAELAEADVVAVIDEGVVPLSGSLDAIRTALELDSVGAVAGKLLAGDGALVAAGTTVFRDGSFAGIAGGSFDVANPWHEFMRDTCGAEGILWLAPSTLNKLDERLVSEREPHPMAWSAGVWAAGLRVRYQPAAAAVAANPKPLSPSRSALIAEAFAPSLAARPERPEQLDIRAWRGLIATDDVEGAWK